MISPRRYLVCLALGLAGCLDENPVDVPGASSSASEIIPASAWLEAGGRLTFRASPVGPFSLRPSQSGVVSLDGAEATAVGPGVVDVEALFPTGKQRASITVSAVRASLHQGALEQGLTEASLLGVWAADTRTVFAVGSGGTVLISRDGALTWERMDSGIQADLTAIWGSSERDIYAVGARGAVIHYDGTKWERVAIPSVDALLEVWGLDANHVYIVGAGVAFAFDGTSWQSMPGAVGSELWSVWGTSPKQLYASGQNGVILRWDGTLWRPMQTPTDFILFGLLGFGADDVYAVGIRGTLLHYDGIRWSPVKIPSRADFFAIAAASKNDIMLVGNAGAVVNYNGTAWTQAPQSASFENLRAVHYDAAGTARIVGWSGTVIERGRNGWVRRLTAATLFSSVVGRDGAVYAVGLGSGVFRRRGSVVTPVPVPVKRDLYGIARAADGSLYIVGDQGTIMASADGVSWHVELAPATVLLRSIWADPSDPNAIFVVGDSGTVLQRTGGRWVRMPTPVNRFLRHVFGLGSRDVYAVGDSGVVLQYEGRHWVRMASPISQRLRGVWGSARNNLVAVGEGGVAIRFDGRRWYSLSTGTDKELRAVFGTGPAAIYAVGPEGLVSRFNGSSWQKIATGSSAFLVALGDDGAGGLIAVGTNQTFVDLTP